MLASRDIDFPLTHDLRALEELCTSNGITIPAKLGDADRLTP